MTYKFLKCNRFIFEFMDIPYYIVKNVEFVSEYKINVSFAEIAEFCVEKYFLDNFNVLQNKKIILKYLDETGYTIRTDTYTLKKICEIKKSTLDYKDDNYAIIKILFECGSHDISTCVDRSWL